MSEFDIALQQCDTAEEAEALAAGLYAGAQPEPCSYCDGEGGEPAPAELYRPCPMCGDTGEAVEDQPRFIP